MKSRNRILAGMVAMVLGGGASAATFEGSLPEPRGEAAAGMELEAQASTDISVSAQVSESFSAEPMGQASVSEKLTYRSVVDEGRPALESERIADASSTSSRSGGLFAWFKGERGPRPMNAQSAAIDGGFVAMEGSSGLINEGDPFVNHQELLASRSEQPKILSRLTGERGSQAPSEQAAAGESGGSVSLASPESSEDPDKS